MGNLDFGIPIPIPIPTKVEKDTFTVTLVDNSVQTFPRRDFSYSINAGVLTVSPARGGPSGTRHFNPLRWHSVIEY